MSRLTTVATFDIPAKAEFAKIVLQDAGIEAVIADEGIVAMDWMLSNAVGGIKVQVRTEEAEKAYAVLNERFGPGGKPASGAIDEDELARQALSAELDEEEDRDDPVEPVAPEIPSPIADPVRPSAATIAQTTPQRDRDALRAFFLGWFALGCPLLGIFSLYFFLCAAFGEGELSSRGRFNLFIAALLVVPSVILTTFILGTLNR